MRAVVQRVKNAAVSIDNKIVGSIGSGALVLLGVSSEDTHADANYILEKILHLRIFDDEDGRMDRSLVESGGELLVVSQFTLFGDVRKGRRPSYIDAAPPDQAEPLYGYFVTKAMERLGNVQTGRFQAKMDIELINDGRVTILIDSKKTF